MCSSVFLLAGLMVLEGAVDWELLVLAIEFSFLHHLGREIIKDCEDVAGDRMIGRRTAATGWGTKIAVTVGAAVYGVMIVITYVAYFVYSLSGLYLLIVTLGVNLPLVLILGSALRRRSGNIGTRIGWLLKTTMITGLLALLVAR